MLQPYNRPYETQGVLMENDDSPEAVAARLRAVRQILGMDKKTFAERAGMSQQTYGPFENGTRALSLEAARKLRKTYGLSLEFMYFGKTDDLPHRIASAL